MCTKGGGKDILLTQINHRNQQSRSSDPDELQQSNEPENSTNQQINYSNSDQSGYSTQQGSFRVYPIPVVLRKAPQFHSSPAPFQPPLATQLQPQSQQSPPSQSQNKVVLVKQDQTDTPMEEETTPEFKPTTTENGDGTNCNEREKTSLRKSKIIRKERQKAKLSHILKPINALSFLNKLRPGSVKFVVQENPGWGYIASVVIDGKVFSGFSFTISKSKELASEQAVKHLLFKKFAKTDTTIAVPPKNTTKEQPRDKRVNTEKEEDELPWGSFGAFALHKLLTKWQKEEAETEHRVSQDKYNEVLTRSMAGVPSFYVLGRKYTPRDSIKIHPVLLLNVLKSNVIYHASQEGKPPHDVFFINTIVLNGKEYVGKGKSKEEAKVNAAKAALLPMGIKYNEDA